MDALVSQKNALLALVNAEEYERATVILDFLAPSWEADGYAYKTREIRERISRELAEKAFHAAHHQTEAKLLRLREKLCK